MPDGGCSTKTIRDAAGLVAAGLASPGALDAVAGRYAIAITPAMQALIRAPGDPIGRQFVPDPAELVTAPHESADPIGDDALSPVPGIVHRYADRALLKPLLACPVYCRFCFRREHVGPGGGVLTEAELHACYAWFRANPQVGEVILTGGDPLMLSPRRLGAILAELAAMPWIETVRIHTRVPVAAPEMITEALCEALERTCAWPPSPRSSPLSTGEEALLPLPRAGEGRGEGAGASLWVVVHANHATELTPGARTALRALHRAGAALLGQSVLLRGVNDSPAALEALFRAMLAARVKPYYLHQLDPAPGTARFHVPVAEGQRILAALRGRVTGLAWPTYVLDIPGGHGKVPIGPVYLDGAHVADPRGGRHELAGPRPAS